MKAALLKQLRRFEEVRPREDLPHDLQIGHVTRLPGKYTGESRIVTIARDPDGNYRWDERRGPSLRTNPSRVAVEQGTACACEYWSSIATKSVERRIDRLEDHLAPRAGDQIIIILNYAGRKLSLDSGRCVQIQLEAAPRHDKSKLLRGLREHT